MCNIQTTNGRFIDFSVCYSLLLLELWFCRFYTHGAGCVFVREFNWPRAEFGLILFLDRCNTHPTFPAFGHFTSQDRNLIESELENKNTPSHPVSCEIGKANGLDINR